MSVDAGLQDGRGCLTPLGVAALAGAPPGKGAPELAAHVVTCARCQGRLLAFGQETARAAGPARAPSLGRTLTVAFILMIALVAALLTLMKLAG